MNDAPKNDQLFRWRGRSLSLGQIDKTIPIEKLPDSPLIKAWLEDIDIMEITLVSTNLGFVYTFTKPFPGWENGPKKF